MGGPSVGNLMVYSVEIHLPVPCEYNSRTFFDNIHGFLKTHNCKKKHEH